MSANEAKVKLVPEGEDAPNPSRIAGGGNELCSGVAHRAQIQHLRESLLKTWVFEKAC